MKGTHPSIAVRSAGAALLLAACLAGCAGPAKAPKAAPAPVADPSLPQPGWVTQPLSWEKLNSIEAWLAGPGRDHSPSLGLEARLQLNEGRLAMVQRDMEGGTAPRAALQSRIEAAARGFEEILTDPSSTPGNQTRAQVGLKAAKALLAAPAPKTAGLPLVTRGQWGAAEPKPKQMTPLRGGWSRITLHHSAESSSSPSGASLEDSIDTVASIQKYHQTDPGHQWGDIGYHFLIDSAGRIFEGRDLAWQGAHASGNNNLQNLGVCLLGDLRRQPPTPEALKSLELLMTDLRSRFRIAPGRMFVHSDFGSTDCPGEHLKLWLKAYKVRHPK